MRMWERSVRLNFDLVVVYIAEGSLYIALISKWINSTLHGPARSH